jgi:hypothetical protein
MQWRSHTTNKRCSRVRRAKALGDTRHSFFFPHYFVSESENLPVRVTIYIAAVCAKSRHIHYEQQRIMPKVSRKEREKKK